MKNIALIALLLAASVPTPSVSARRQPDIQTVIKRWSPPDWYDDVPLLHGVVLGHAVLKPIPSGPGGKLVIAPLIKEVERHCVAQRGYLSRALPPDDFVVGDPAAGLYLCVVEGAVAFTVSLTYTTRPIGEYAVVEAENGESPRLRKPWLDRVRRYEEAKAENEKAAAEARERTRLETARKEAERERATATFKANLKVGDRGCYQKVRSGYSTRVEALVVELRDPLLYVQPNGYPAEWIERDWLRPCS